MSLPKTITDPVKYSAKKTSSLQISFLFGILISLFIFIQPAFSQTATSLAPAENATNFILTFLTGTIARSVAIIAVAVFGFMAFRGRMSWGIAGGIIVMIVCVFGGATIVDAIIAAI
jgi:type IV secretion system protein VirB2